MDTDAALLGSRPSLASGSFRSLASPSHPVGLLFIPTIIHLLTWLLLVCSEDPGWKRLISRTLTMDERISLISTIFLDHNQVEVVGQLSGGDAQTFVDMIDEASPTQFQVQ